MKPLTYNHSALLLVSHWRVLLRVAQNDLKGRYAGSVFGIGWAILNPLLMLAVYAVVYLVIFRVRAPNLSPVQYVLYIFAGLVPFLMTSEALSAGVGSVVANRSVLNNTVFPIDLAPVKAVLLSQIPMVVGMGVILVSLLFTGMVTWTIVLLPILWLLHVLGLIGLIWVLSLINLVFRDLQNVIGLIMLIVMVVSPIAYTPDMVPSSLKLLVIFNPFAYFVLTYQKIIVLGQMPEWSELFILFMLSFLPFVLGGFFFTRAKGALIDYV